MDKRQLYTDAITDKAELFNIFKQGIKNKSEFKIGLEQEKIGVNSNNFQAVPYSSEKGVLEFLKQYKNKFNNWNYWPDEHLVLGLENPSKMITLEPGSQLEISTVPQVNVHLLKDILEEHTRFTSQLGESMGIFWLGSGLQPVSTYNEISIIPKDRYNIMTEYLPTKAALPFVMMRESAGIQTAVDYDSEEDCMKKLKLSLALSPIVTAMFANSPIRNTQDSGYKSFRAYGWLHVDEDRCGLVSKKFFDKSSKELSFDDYVDVLLDLPMIFLEKEDKWFNMKGLSFRKYMQDGFNGYHATIDDWKLHLTSFFPDIRLKNYIEIRNCDCQKADNTLALPALWKGIMYTQEAIDAACDLIKDLSWEDAMQLRHDVPKLALQTELKGKKLSDYAKELIQIAENSLNTQSSQNNYPSESVYLEKLKELVLQNKSPADVILSNWHGRWNKDISKFVEYARLK